MRAPYYDWVAWVDSDIVFHDTSRSIPNIVREFSPGGAQRPGGGAGATSDASTSTPGGAERVVAWFPCNWPWRPREPNSGFFVLRGTRGGEAIALVARWWSFPNMRKWNHRHKYEQEPLIEMWRELSGERRGGHGGGDSAAPRAAMLRSDVSGEWRMMTDLNYERGPRRRADDTRTPMTHMAEGNDIVPAWPYARNATFPSMLTALSLDAVVRAEAVRRRTAAGDTDDESAAAAVCRAGGGQRTQFFRVHTPNTSLSEAAATHALAEEVPPAEWMSHPRPQSKRGRGA